MTAGPGGSWTTCVRADSTAADWCCWRSRHGGDASPPPILRGSAAAMIGAVHGQGRATLPRCWRGYGGGWTRPAPRTNAVGRADEAVKRGRRGPRARRPSGDRPTLVVEQAAGPRRLQEALSALGSGSAGGRLLQCFSPPRSPSSPSPFPSMGGLSLVSRLLLLLLLLPAICPVEIGCTSMQAEAMLLPRTGHLLCCFNLRVGSADGWHARDAVKGELRAVQESTARTVGLGCRMFRRPEASRQCADEPWVAASSSSSRSERETAAASGSSSRSRKLPVEPQHPRCRCVPALRCAGATSLNSKLATAMKLAPALALALALPPSCPFSRSAGLAVRGPVA